MKTEVVIKRPFVGYEIRQKSKSGLLCVTDLVRVGNIKRKELGLEAFNLTAYLNRKSTKEFIEELQKEAAVVHKRDRKGRNGATWAHPLLFMDIALTMNPKFKVEVYNWIKDELLRYRNESGESYKKMIGALYQKAPHDKFQQTVQKVATYIRKEIGVRDWNEASEDDLRLRDKVHEQVAFMLDVLSSANWRQAVKIAVDKTIENHRDNQKEQQSILN